MALTMQHWLKTQDGEETLASKAIFCYEGKLFQGAYSVDERVLLTKEMEAVLDKDGSLKQVWLTRRQRIEGDYNQKDNEYGTRRVELITRRNEILTAIEREQKLLGRTSSALLRDVEKIDARLERISLAQDEGEVELETQKKSELIEEVSKIAQEIVDATCVCGKGPKEGHANPKGWLNGHRMKCAKYAEMRKEELATA